MNSNSAQCNFQCLERKSNSTMVKFTKNNVTGYVVFRQLFLKQC